MSTIGQQIFAVKELELANIECSAYYRDGSHMVAIIFMIETKYLCKLTIGTKYACKYDDNISLIWMQSQFQRIPNMLVTSNPKQTATSTV